MTDNDTPADQAMPSFLVNVVPVSQIRREHLAGLLARFRAGNPEPLIFGEDDKPEAAVIPFADLVRLMKSQHATDQAEQASLVERIQTSDRSRAQRQADAIDLDELGDELGEPARSIIRGLSRDDE